MDSRGVQISIYLAPVWILEELDATELGGGGASGYQHNRKVPTMHLNKLSYFNLKLKDYMNTKIQNSEPS